MSTSPEGAAIFFKTWKSTFAGHLGLQSMSYRVGTPCTYKESAQVNRFQWTPCPSLLMFFLSIPLYELP